MKRQMLGCMVMVLLSFTTIASSQDYPQPSIPSGTTLVCIYAVGNEYESLVLPQWWDEVWQDGSFPGLPSYFKDVSGGQYLLHGAAIGHGNMCYRSDSLHTPNNHGWSVNYGPFAREMVALADADVRFDRYANELGIVYGAIVCPVPFGNGVFNRNGRLVQDIVTNDYLRNGVRVRFHVVFMEEEDDRNTVVALSVHELGHQLGFPDIGYSTNNYALGGYDVMGASDPGMGFWSTDPVDVIPSPYNPARRVLYGWLICEDILQSVENLRIRDISAGTVYKIASPVDPYQYFLLSSYTSNDGYEMKWPGEGLLVWHINNHAGDYSPSDPDVTNWERPRAHPADIECAYGLWDWVLQGDDWVTTAPNPILGKDSLDIRGIYNPIGQTPVNPVGSPSDFYPGPTDNREFTPFSNPSSNFYRIADGFPEDVFSGIQIRNIHRDAVTGEVILDVDMSMVPPGTPSKPVANNTNDFCSTDLAWAPAQCATVYEVYQGDYSSGVYSDPTLIGTTGATSYHITGLEPGKIYYYKLRAINAYGTYGEYSDRTLVSTYERFKGNGSRCLAHKVNEVNNNPEDTWYSCNARQHDIALTTYDRVNGAVTELIAQGDEASLGCSGDKLMAAVTCRVNSSTQQLYGYWRPANSPGSWTEVPLFTHTGDSVYIGSPSLVVDASGNAHITWVSCVGLKPGWPKYWWRWTYRINYCVTSADFQNPQYAVVKSYEWHNDDFDPADAVLYGASIANGYDGPNVIWASQGSICHSKKSGGAFGAATVLHDNIATGINAAEPFIDAKINGSIDQICAVWAANLPGGSKREIFRCENTNGSWSSPLNISNTPEHDSRCPQVAINSENENSFIWREERGVSRGWDAMIDYTEHMNEPVHIHATISQGDLISFGPQIIDCADKDDNPALFLQWYADDLQCDRWFNSKKYYANAPTKGAHSPDDRTNHIDPPMPAVTFMGRNTPNPFSHSTTINYQLSKPGSVAIQIYNISGQCICKLVDAVQQPGYYSVRWDGRDEHGQKLSNGIYFVNLRSSGVTTTNRMTLVR